MFISNDDIDIKRGDLGVIMVRFTTATAVTV